MLLKKRLTNRGSSLIIVACIMAVFTILSSTILLSSYRLITAQSKEFTSTQVEFLASSYTNTLSEILSVPYTVYGNKDANISGGISEFVDTRIYEYICADPYNNSAWMSSYRYWFYYNDSETDPKHTNEQYTKLKFTSVDDNYSGANISMLIYWVTDADGDSALNSGLETQTGNDTRTQINKMKLVTEVTVEYNNEEYSVTNEYGLNRTQTYINNALLQEVWYWTLNERY